MMLTFAGNFWLVFWTIIGAGALLTVLAVLLVAAFSPSRRDQDSAPAELATVYRSSVASGHDTARHSEAA